MSRVVINEEFTTQLKDENFLYFAENSSLGIAIIQRGYLKYFNQRFAEIFRYSEDEILQWKKREFYKIVHSEDLPNLVKNFTVEDGNTVSVRFRGVTKDTKVFELENYICMIKFNNKTAYLSSYVPLEEIHVEPESYTPKTIRMLIKKKITMDYNPAIVKLLRNNNVKFDIIEHCLFREED
ncbi:MAG: PAS domain-containing protein [Candidatus Thorarchaeota archaeon]